jgi:hypothetical protein
MKIADHEDSAVIELQGLQAGVDPNKALAAFQPAAIVPTLYDTTPLIQDIAYGAGMQEQNQVPISPKGTATAATINEQAKMTITSSNVDDLDDMLSDLAEDGGEIILRYFDIETVRHIAGRGAALPQDPMQRVDFLNEVYLKVKAASSGRPNKALEVSNLVQLIPLLQAAGANPVGVVELVAHAIDEQLELEKLLPLVPPAMPASNGPSPKPLGPNGKGSPNPPQSQHPVAPAMTPVGAHQ